METRSLTAERVLPAPVPCGSPRCEDGEGTESAVPGTYCVLFLECPVGTDSQGPFSEGNL